MHSAIVLDINSGSVGAGVVLLRKHLPPALMYSYRKNFHVSGEEKIELPAHSQASGRSRSIQFSPLRLAMCRALNQVLRQTYNDGLVTLAKKDRIPKKIDHILVTISSVWGEADLDIIEEEIEKVVGSKRGICVKDFIFVLAHTLGISGQEDTLIVSISGAVTESIAVSDIGERRSTHVAYGPEVLTQKIVEMSKLDYHLASSLVHLYAQNALEVSKREEVEGLISDELERWREEIFNTASAQRVRKIFLFADSSFSNLVGRIFKSAYPSAEIQLEERDPLEMLTAFSNSLL